MSARKSGHFVRSRTKVPRAHRSELIGVSELHTVLRTTTIGRQSGAALLIVLAVIAIMTGAVLVHTFGVSAQQEQRARRTEASLSQAKEALIFYAASYADTHPGEVLGYLPCPDTATTAMYEGTPNTSSTDCTLKDVTALGRLPWRTLGLPDLRDGNGECLWYAVSGNFKGNLNKTDLMNWDTNGLITVLAADGSIVAAGSTPSGAVAVIFSPGPAIGNQSRTGLPATPVCGGNYIATNYLDAAAGSNNATLTGMPNRVDTFVMGTASNSFNDRLMFITAKDIFDAVERRQHVDPENPSARVSFANLMKTITRRTAECIAAYPRENRDHIGDYDRRMPWTTDHPFGSDNYGPAVNYDDEDNHYFGRTPWRVDRSKNDTDNEMSGTTLFSTTLCPAWSQVDPWWRNWKDHFFYTVSRDFAPDGDDTNTNCGDCVSVNGSEYASVVFFGGKRLPGQNRNNDLASSISTAKSNVANYLESDNATEPGTPDGRSGRGNYRAMAEDSTFNDVLYCIRQDLSVIECP